MQETFKTLTTSHRRRVNITNKQSYKQNFAIAFVSILNIILNNTGYKFKNITLETPQFMCTSNDISFSLKNVEHLHLYQYFYILILIINT